MSEGRGGCAGARAAGGPFWTLDRAAWVCFTGDGGAIPSSALRLVPEGATDDGDADALSRNFKGGIFGLLASSSFRLQSRQTKWKSSFSAASCEIPRHLLCCQTLHFSHATLWLPSSCFKMLDNGLFYSPGLVSTHQILTVYSTARTIKDPLIVLG